jgi:hypothetical protein
MVISHKHRKAEGFSSGTATFADLNKWGSYSDTVLFEDIYTDNYGGSETKPASISALVCVSY